MEYIKATEQETKQIFKLVQDTITNVYPKYYPKEVVDFFCSHHSMENISRDIKNGCVGILLCDGQIVGTGSYAENHITRVYVSPEFQGKGCGSYIMDRLEEEIGSKYNSVHLDASLPACRLYEHRGYRTVSHEKLPVDNDVVLIYEIMEKQIVHK